MIKKISILLIIIVCFLFLGFVGIASFEKNSQNDNNNNTTIEETYYDTYTYLTSDIIENAQPSKSLAEFKNSFTPEFLLEEADAIVIASVISLDEATTKYSQAVGHTIGKMVINNTLMGDLKTGDVITYFKSGGIMTLEEYEKYQPDDEAKAKRQKLREEAGIDISKEYINRHFDFDIDIEEGCVYLCYLKYIQKYDKWEIIGLGNGFRKLDIDKKSKVSAQTYSLKDYKLLNNMTKEYESLNEYVTKNINNNENS